MLIVYPVDSAKCVANCDILKLVKMVLDRTKPDLPVKLPLTRFSLSVLVLLQNKQYSRNIQSKSHSDICTRT